MRRGPGRMVKVVGTLLLGKGHNLEQSFLQKKSGLTNIIRGDSGGFLGTHPHHPRQYGVISFGKVTKDNIVIGLA